MEGWEKSRDAIVRAALAAMAEHGASLDFLAMQKALEAAFKEAARQHMATDGSDSTWFVLARHASRMGAP